MYLIRYSWLACFFVKVIWGNRRTVIIGPLIPCSSRISPQRQRHWVGKYGWVGQCEALALLRHLADCAFSPQLSSDESICQESIHNLSVNGGIISRNCPADNVIRKERASLVMEGGAFNALFSEVAMETPSKGVRGTQ